MAWKTGLAQTVVKREETGCEEDLQTIRIRGALMEKTIKILHVDMNWDVVYILIRDGVLLKSTVPLKTAVDLLKKVKFDLILSEPQNKAVLTPQTATDHINYIKYSLASHRAGKREEVFR